MKKFLLSLALLLGLSLPAAAQQTNAQIFNLTTGPCKIRAGSGSPEGVVTGNKCDVYLRSNGGTDTTLYVKESGSGNTGWVAAGGGASAWTNPMTSAAVATIISDETGSGKMVFDTTPTFTTSLFTPKIYGGTGANGTLILVSTSGTGDGSGAVKIQGGTNGGTLIATFNNDGSANFSGNLQSQNFTTTGYMTATKYIRAGAADSTAPADGDLVANRGGVPGSGAVFFGGSANLHYLYYDGTTFNLTDSLLPTADNTKDIGSASFRPRTLYFGTSLAGGSGVPTASIPIFKQFTRDGQIQEQLYNDSATSNAYAEYLIKNGSVSTYFGSENINSSDTFGAGRGYLTFNGTGTGVPGGDFFACAGSTPTGCFFRWIVNSAGASGIRMIMDGTASQFMGSNANAASVNIKSATVSQTCNSGTGTCTATNLIPAGATVVSVTARVTTILAGAALTTWSLGDGTTADLWATGKALAAGTTVNATDHKSTWNIKFYSAANNVVLTAAAGVFSSGVVRITVFYLDSTAPTS